LQKQTVQDTTAHGTITLSHIHTQRAKDVITQKVTPTEKEPGSDTQPAVQGESV